MAQMAYLMVKGSKSGSIKGSITQKGKEGLIGVVAVSHQIDAPFDAASGQPSGKLQHRSIRLTKELDSSTPLLLQMLTTNELVKDFKLDFYDHARDGKEQNSYRIELTNAKVVSYDFRQADTRDPDKAKLACYEEVGFVYQKITWTWLIDVKSATDDWSSS